VELAVAADGHLGGRRGALGGELGGEGIEPLLQLPDGGARRAARDEKEEEGEDDGKEPAAEAAPGTTGCGRSRVPAAIPARWAGPGS